jgi:hypothetical protein
MTTLKNESEYKAANLTPTFIPTTEAVTPPKTCSERIASNRHFARLLRQRLESRHEGGALRETLDKLTDAELVEKYLANEQQGRNHCAKTQAQKQADKVNHLLRRAEKETS